MSVFTPQTFRFIQQLQAQHQAVAEYESPQWQRQALQCIPVQQLEERARTDSQWHTYTHIHPPVHLSHHLLSAFDTLSLSLFLYAPVAAVTDAAARLSFRDQLLKQLLHWYKHDFFTWTNQPKCSQCQSDTQPIGHAQPTLNERQGRAGIVELYRCSRCSTVVRYPRYNHPLKLLETRSGRCGEWANCFTLLCRAMQFEARATHDWTDHVWTEVYSEQQRRWIHCDPCEDAMDRPELYEGGWGKKLNYVVAVSRDDVVDVTRRYTKKYDEVKRRRTLCPEAQLQVAVSMMNLTLWARQSADRRRVLLERQAVEQRELHGDTVVDHVLRTGQLAGRTTGSAEWRRARGEMGDEQKTQAALAAQEETKQQLHQQSSQTETGTATAAAVATPPLPASSSSSTTPIPAATAPTPTPSPAPSASSTTSASVPPSSSASTSTAPAESGKDAVKLLFSRYHAQLTRGCGRQDCTNDACKSSSKFVASGDESAAGIAKRCLQLTSQFKASKLCENVNDR